MKHIELFESFSDDVISDKERKNALELFNAECKKFNFEAAFNIAQDEGLFGGNFTEYMHARSRQGNVFDEMIRLYEEYKKVASKLSELIISDIKDAQDDYGHSK